MAIERPDFHGRHDRRPLRKPEFIRKPYVPPTPAEQEQKTAETFKQMQAGVNAMLKDPEGYFDRMSRFHEYSWGNIGMIMSQRPDATHVAGFNAWREKFGRFVKKGEKGITILAPMVYNTKIQDEDTGEEISLRNLRGFRSVKVFDISQTDGQPLPDVPVARLSGQDPLGDELWSRVSDYVVSRGVSHYKAPMPQNGVFLPRQREIVTNEMLSGDQEIKTFIHEAAHMTVFADDEKAAKLDRKDHEMIAEGAAYVTLRHFGIDSSGYSFGYLAGWARDGQILARNMGATQKTANELITVITHGAQTPTNRT